MAHAYDRSGRSLWTLWALLTVAAAGFALLAAGIYLESNRWIGLGTGVFTLGGIAFLTVQFWKVGTMQFHGPRPMPVAAPALVPAAAAPIPAPPTGHLDELVEFQLVDHERKAPAQLQVPEAFQIESSIDAAPPEPDAAAVFPWLLNEGGESKESFVPATERRKEIVHGLPLLSSIFSTESPPTRTVAPERPGRTRGQCGGCGTMLWAPTQRPLRLRCPKCGHVRTLTE